MEFFRENAVFWSLEVVQSAITVIPVLLRGARRLSDSLFMKITYLTLGSGLSKFSMVILIFNLEDYR